MSMRLLPGELATEIIRSMVFKNVVNTLFPSPCRASKNSEDATATSSAIMTSLRQNTIAIAISGGKIEYQCIKS